MLSRGQATNSHVIFKGMFRRSIDLKRIKKSFFALEVNLTSEKKKILVFGFRYWFDLQTKSL